MPNDVEKRDNPKSMVVLPVWFCGPPGRKWWTFLYPRVDLPYETVDLPVFFYKEAREA